MQTRKSIALILALALICALVPWGDGASVSAATFADMPLDWSTDALEKTVANGLISGFEENGRAYIKPTANLTRAQMAAIVNRAFGATEKASLSGVRDVPTSEWFAEDMQRAIRMETFKQDTLMRPNDPITRQEAFTVLARAFQLTGTGSSVNTGALNSFTDGSRVASYARESVSAMINSRYVAGSDGKLNPEANISRAEFAKVMDNMAKAYGRVGSTTVSQSTVNGNLIINKPNITLKDTTVRGNLIIGDGVGSGGLTLDNTDVTGDILVRGGGQDGILIKSNCSVNTMTIAKIAGGVRVIAESGSSLDDLRVVRSDSQVTLEGTFDDIHVDERATISFQNAKADVVKVNATSTLNLDKNTKVAQLDVLNNAASTRINNEGTIAKLRADVKITLSGKGTVTEQIGLTGTTAVTAIGSISGTPRVGNELKAGSLTPSNANVNYQWKSASSSNGTYTNISGATGSTYTPTADDVDRYIRVVVTGKGSYTGTVTSAAVGPVEISAVRAQSISGVTVPKAGEKPVTSLASTSEYTAKIAWSPGDSTFAQNTVYTATITLTPKSGYTLRGVVANQFRVSGASATNSANSGVITAVFPSTGGNYADGLSPSLVRMDPAQEGRMYLTLSTAPSSGYKMIYRVTGTNPSAPLKDEVLSGSGWTDLTTTGQLEISINDGQYVQVAEVKSSSNRVNRWGKVGPADDGYTTPVPASGLTLKIESGGTASPPAVDSVIVTITGGDSGSVYYYRVGSEAAPNAATTLNPQGWTGIRVENRVALIPSSEVASGNIVQIVETTSSNVVLRWGQEQASF